MSRNSLSLLLLTSALVLMVGGGGYYHFLYPPSVKKRQVRAQLQEFSDIVATHDRVRISGKLTELLAEDVKISLQISFFAIVQMNNNRAINQDFDKASFIGFLDNTLYTLDNYAFTPRLGDFTLQGDQAQLSFSAPSFAEGMSYFLGTGVNSRFSTNIECTGQVTFKEPAAQIDKLNCQMVLHITPSEADMNKLRDPAMYQDYLKQR